MNILKGIGTFILSAILFGCLLALAMFCGVKYGGFKGKSVDEILDKSDAYEAFGETTREVLVAHFGDDKFKAGLMACMPDKMIADMSRDVVQALSNKQEVDLTATLSSTEEFAENVTNYVYDQIFENLSENPVITASTVRNLPVLSDAKDTLGIDLSDVIIINLDLDNNPIDTSEVVTEENLQILKDSSAKPMANVIALYIYYNTDDINSAFNRELMSDGRFNQLYDYMDMTNYVIAHSMLIAGAIIFVSLLFAFFIFLLYIKKPSTGIRIIGVDFMVTGTISLIIAAALKFGKDVNAGALKRFTGFSLEKTLSFLKNLCNNLALPICICAGIYLVIGILLTILASRSHRKQYS